MKTAFLIAGFHKRADQVVFEALRKAIAAKGYKVVPVPFDWAYTTPTAYARKFVKFYNNNKSEHNIVIGNSFGAVVAFLTAMQLRPNGIVLCSLSPFFQEDVATMDRQKALKKFGPRRVNDLESYSAKAIAKLISQSDISVVMMYGEQEKTDLPHLVERVKAVAKDIPQAKLVEAKGAPHSLRDPAYVKAIAQVL